jgi:hypothetical protein
MVDDNANSSQTSCNFSSVSNCSTSTKPCESSVDELGWFGLFREEKAILTEDSQGFVDVEQFDTDEKLQEVWELLALSSTI